MSGELKLFCCYAQEDEEYRAKLENHLAGLKRLFNLTYWSDREVLGGDNRYQVVNKNLETADIILLLVSPDFVASGYCDGIEMQQALERYRAGKCRVVPIWLRPTYWETTPFKDIQFLPKNGRPIASWNKEDEAFYYVVEGISDTIKAVLRSRGEDKQWFVEGLELYDQKKYNNALSKFEKVLVLDPNFLLAWTAKAITLNALEKYDQALTASDRALGLDRGSAPAWHEKGQALLNLFQSDEALAAFEEALRLDPKYVFAWSGKATALVWLDRYDEAVMAYEEAIQLDPGNTWILNAYALALEWLDKGEEAQPIYAKIRQLRSQKKDLHSTENQQV